MIIVLREPTAEQVDRVLDKIRQHGLEPHCLRSADKIIVTAFGESATLSCEQLQRLPGVEKVVPVVTPFKLVSRQFRPENTVVTAGNAAFGERMAPVIAGPCAVESYEQLLRTALAVKAAGAVLLRGGAFKPRTSPYSFQGLEFEGLRILQQVSRQTGLPVVSEVADPRVVEAMAEHVAVLQIGARNMQNFALLKEVALVKNPVLLKRGPAATVEEWLMAAEYIVTGGNDNVVLCERGIRTFETYTRNSLDISAVPLVKQISHLPVIVDPSHGTGHWRLVGPMAKAALAAGADGLMIEVHPSPEEAASDGPQSLTPANFTQLMAELAAIAAAVGRTVTAGPDKK